MTEPLKPSDSATCEFPALCEFIASSKVPAGFGYFSSDGEILPEYEAQLQINCRMTHMFFLSALAGIHPGLPHDLAAHGIYAITDYFRDPEYSGWFSQIETEPDDAGCARPNLERAPRKEVYAHAFVIVAASSAIVAGIPRARVLLTGARRIQDCYQWEEAAGRVHDIYVRDWSDCEAYRGASANVHTFESILAAFDAMGDSEYLCRAASIAGEVINQSARENSWRIPECYTTDWRVDFRYNRDNPTDPFQPWGATPGRSFEWTRLILQLRATVQVAGLDSDLGWVPEAARAVYPIALGAWGVDGAPGIPYTTDFEGKPMSTRQMHWVVCEALGVSLTISRLAVQFPERGILAQTTVRWCEKFSVYTQEYLVEAPGRWWHGLNRDNHSAALTWPGEADTYHADQAMFLVDLPVMPGFAVALRSRS